MNERETTETRTSTVEESAPKATMGEFGHTNPYTDEAFGDEMAFERGPAVAADGGRAKVDGDGADEQTMDDVDHEHPHEDAADANAVFERGSTAPARSATETSASGTAADAPREDDETV